MKRAVQSIFLLLRTHAGQRTAWAIICIWALLHTFLCGCNNKERRDIESYYFPVKELRKGKVYEYAVSNQDSIALEYWYYRGVVRDSGLFLSGTFYDQSFQIGQMIREKITSGGALAKECNLYEAPPSPEDPQVQIPTIIDKPNVFPFSVGDSTGAYVFELRFSPPDDPQSTIYLSRERRFVGDAPDFEFNGQNHPCIRFAVHETIRSQKNAPPDLESFGEERYAKGLGLVYYSKAYGKSAFKIESRLTDIFYMQELEEKDRGN
ncbi:MAG: hypothetical protein JNJ57_04200 [Saprospiraceae bacterium]|nr:hypothetical protein [Saprospiraceae bacterium]